MDVALQSETVDILEGYGDDEFPWAGDLVSDWQAFVSLYGNEVASLALSQATIDWPPPTVALDMSTKCNLRCPMCLSNGDAEARETYTRRQYDWRMIADFIIRNGGVRTLAIGSLGESFLKHDTLDLMETLKDHVEDFAFSTNATAIETDLIKEVAKYKVSSIRLSCDAGDEESYPIWRKGADFETFAANAREFGRLFGDRVAIHSVLFRENMESLKKVPALAKDLGLGMVEIHTLRLKGAARRNGLHCTSFEETCEFFNAVFEMADDLGIVISPVVFFPDGEMAREAFERTNGRIGNRNFVHEVSQPRCGEPWRMINISHNGEISPCCGGFEGEKVSGNPFEYPGKALLNLQSVVLLRAMILAGYAPSVCQFYCRKCYR